MKSSESTLLDFISSPILQYVQNSYAQKYNIAVLIQDGKGRPLTQVTQPEWLKFDQSLQIFVDAQLRTVPDPLRRGLLDGHVAYDSYFQGLWYNALVPLLYNREFLGVCQIGYSSDSGSVAWEKHARACQDFLFEKNSYLYFQDPQPHAPTEKLVLLATGLQSQLQRLLDAGWHRRQARLAGDESQLRTEKSEGNGSSASLITTRSFDVIEADAAVVSMLRYDHGDELVGLNFFSHLVYQKSKGVELVEFIEQEIPVSQYELDLACKDGTPCPVVLSVVVQKNFHDEPVGYQFLFAGPIQAATVPPLTAKQHEPAQTDQKPATSNPNLLRDQLADLYAKVTRRELLGDPLLQHVTQPLFVLDPVNRVLLWNQAMETLLNIPALSILENRFDQLLLDSSRALWHSWLSEFRLDPGDEDFIPEKRLELVDNKGRIVQSRIQMSKNTVLGQELITVTLLHPVLASEGADVAESKPQPRHDYFALSLAEAPLYRPGAQVQQLRSLVGSVTRQIEHSLMNISAPIETSLWTDLAGKKWRSSFGRFHHDLEAMMMMVRRLQYFALNFEYRPQLMPLHRLIRQAVGLQTQLFANPVQLQLDTSAEVGLIMGDVSLLQQAIDFVCQNALEALQVRGDMLIVRTRPATMPETGNAAILLEVLDNGPGIAEDILPRLFQPFVTTKSGERGYGLGLAAASGIIQRHEGVMQIMTRSGLGTAVQIFLPAPVLNKVALEMEAAEEPAASGAQHLLLVDDEPFLLLIWKTALEQAGYVVHGAGTADEAFALFKKEKSKIKCAIIDVQLLDSSGTELAKKILPLKPIPIIMTSGLQPDGTTMSVIEASRGRFVLKPVGISKLLQIIKSVI